MQEKKKREKKEKKKKRMKKHGMKPHETARNRESEYIPERARRFAWGARFDQVSESQVID